MASDAPRGAAEAAKLAEAAKAADKAYKEGIRSAVNILAHPFKHGLRMSVLGAKMLLAYSFCIIANDFVRLMAAVGMYTYRFRAARESRKGKPPR